MAFGQELQDFVSGFKTGRQVVEDSLDREERKERYGVEDARDTRNFNRLVGRDAASDARDTRDYTRLVGRDAEADRDDDRDHNLRVERYGRQDAQWETSTALEKERLQQLINEYKLKLSELQGADGVGPDAMGDYLKKKGVGGSGDVQNSLTPSAGDDQSAIPENPFIQYANQGATRNQPLSAKLEGALAFLPELGVQAKVFSGGQDAEGPNRTGSHRHDHGEAGDVFFYKDGKRLDWNDPEDLPIFEEIVRRGKAAGLTGFGAGKGYMQPGSMHLGFGEPAVWGAGGSSVNAPAWLRDAYYGKKVAGMARGGLVDPLDDYDKAIPDDEPTEVASLPAPSQAIPDSPMPTPSYGGEGVEVADNSEKPTDDPYERGRRSVRDGLKQAAATLGLNREGAIDDPDMEKARQNYLRGYGAAPKQMMRQVMDTIDPERKMDPGERSLKAMGEVYQFYMDKGETEKAKEAAQSMLQYYRLEFNKYTALAQTAAQNGDLDTAAKAAVAAYGSIPNGRNFAVKKVDDGYEISVTDAKTGKDVTRKVMNPRDIAAAAMNFNPGTFDDEILNAAGVAPDTFKEQTGEQLAEAETNVTTPVAELLDKMGITDEKKAATIRDFASGIAQTPENNMAPQRAAEFAAIVASSPKEAVSIKPVRGVPDRYRVTVNGQSVVVTGNDVAGLKGMQDADAKAKAEADAKAKEPSKVLQNVGRFFDMMGGAMSKEADNLTGGKPVEGSFFNGTEPAPQQGPQQPVPAERAVPETAATQQADPGNVIETLLARRRVLAERNDPRTADMIRMINARLKQLGYTGQ